MGKETYLYSLLRTAREARRELGDEDPITVELHELLDRKMREQAMLQQELARRIDRLNRRVQRWS